MVAIKPTIKTALASKSFHKTGATLFVKISKNLHLVNRDGQYAWLF